MRVQTRGPGLGARISEMVRYGAVGGSLVVIEYAVYLSIVYLFPGAGVSAYVLSRLLAMVGGFVGHSRLTFRINGLSPQNGLRYVVLVLANMTLGAALLAMTLPLLGVLAAKLASDVAVILLSYVIGRRLVFASSGPEAGA